MSPASCRNPSANYVCLLSLRNSYLAPTNATAHTTAALTADTATTNGITPILLDINDILTTALGEVKLLIGAPLGDILLSAEGAVVLEVSDVAQLLSTLVAVSIFALSAVLPQFFCPSFVVL